MIMSRKDFVSLILDEQPPTRQGNPRPSAPTAGVLFDASIFGQTPHDGNIGFARTLLEGSGFGDGIIRETNDVILGENSAKRSLPKSCWLWPKTSDRQHRTILFQLDLPGSELLNDGLFNEQRKQKRLEDALHRLIQTAQQGFAKGGDKRTADVEKGDPDETLIVMSVNDDRNGQDSPTNLVCFATVSKETGSFESFVITDQARLWAKENRALAEDHVSRIFYRQFEKLASERWQDAFVTGTERTLARKLLEVCTVEKTNAKLIQENAIALIKEIAKSFGRGHQSPKIEVDALPSDHFIGADPKVAEKPGFRNDFEGMTIRDGRERLLGYIIYCLDEKNQAEKLRRTLEEHNSFHNVLVIYPDRNEANLELWQGKSLLRGKLIKAGAQFKGEGSVVNLLSRFFVVSKNEISSPIELARDLAYRANYLKVIALAELRREQTLKDNVERPILDLYEIFNQALARQNEKEFADAYAQTLAYGLLAARWMSQSIDKPFTTGNVVSLLPSTSPFLADLFQRLIELHLSPRLGWLIDDLVSLLHRTSVREVFARETRDPVIHFYEDFLDAYDPSIRAARGVYYTPDEVVQYIVNTTHQQLIDEFKIPLGLADCMTWTDFAKMHKLTVPEGVNAQEPFVQILDPASGTGTFLKYTIEVIHDTMMKQWAGANWYKQKESNISKYRDQWTAYVRHSLLPRLNAFELIMAPYIVCHLRLGLLLEETGFEFGKDDRLRVFLTNTLEQSIGTQLQLLGEHVAEESTLADYVKNKTPISVIIGNPPYEREPNDPDASHKGGWMRDGWGGWRNARPPLEDYLQPARDSGAGGHLKNIYNLYVYFWRWATWRVFDSLRPGIVSLITASSFLRGPGFIGLRRNWKEAPSSLHILDLEGDQKGARKTENIFNIMIPVAVSTLTRAPATNGWSGYYCRVEGTRSEKLAKCQEIKFLGDCSWSSIPIEGDLAFVSSEAGEHRFIDWPLMTDIFPWQHSGAQFKRKWPIAFEIDTLAARWSALLSEPNRAESYRETRDRKVTSQYPHLFADGIAQPPISRLDANSAMPPVSRYAYRSFDNQWCMADNRLGDFIRPPLWRTWGIRQLYVVSLLTKVLGEGPAAVATAYVPDLDYFCNRGGKDVIPLWRNAEGTEANICNAAFSTLRDVFGSALTPEDLLAYCYAVLANPGYTKHFRNELQIPGPRIPITKISELFFRGAGIGRTLVQLHTYGERFPTPTLQFNLTGSAKVASSIPTSPESYPETFNYDSLTQILTIGKGRIANVLPEVWDFSVSGFEVVKSWLKYRMKNGAGKKSSPLDDIRCEAWTQQMTDELLSLLHVIESTVSLYAQLDALLEDILHHDLFTADELPKPSDPERQEPRIRQGNQLSIT